MGFLTLVKTITDTIYEGVIVEDRSSSIIHVNYTIAAYFWPVKWIASCNDRQKEYGRWMNEWVKEGMKEWKNEQTKD